MQRFYGVLNVLRLLWQERSELELSGRRAGQGPVQVELGSLMMGLGDRKKESLMK